MGTYSISLPAQAWMPTASPAGFASAKLQVRQSDVAVPSIRWVEWLFADDTDNFLVTQFQIPQTYISTTGPSLQVYYKMSAAASGSVVWGVRCAAVSNDDTTPIDTDAFTTASDNVLGDVVNDLAGALNVLTVPIDNADGAAAGDWITICLWRDGDGTYDTDDADSDAEFLGADFLWSDT